MLPASLAAWVPVFIATATSAWASAGASLVPSPVMATRRPCALDVADQLELGLRRGLGQEVVDAGLGGDRGRGERVVAGDHDGPDAHAPELGEALPDAALDDVLELDDARAPRRRRRPRAAWRPPWRSCPPTAARSAGKRAAEAARRAPRWRRPRPCGPAGRSRFTPLMRVWAVKATKVAPSFSISRSRIRYFSLARTTMLRPSGVSSASEASWAASASVASVTPVGREEGGGLPVAERDRAGLVEQQDVHVARRLHRAAGHGDDVLLDHAVHARDADGGQERADGGRDQADEQGHQHGDRHRRSLPGRPDAVERERQQGGGGEQEDDGQRGEQDVERDLVRGLLPLRALDQRDHPVQERLARVGGDLDDEPVRQHLGAAGDRAAVAAGSRGSPARSRR